MTARALLDPASADRLAKILGLLGSEHCGERDAAAQAAHKLICSFGLTWHDVISPPIVPGPPRIRSWRSTESDWQKMAAFCHARWHLLSDRDREFVRSMLNWREPSERQKDWLASIYARMCREAAA
jgi:hypothetical protein